MSSRPAQPYPLGATWDGHGVNFAVFSEHARKAELCLFGPGPRTRTRRRLPLCRHEAGVWCIYVEGLRPGQLYAYRFDGPFCPEEGHFFNPSKLLLDPYARAIDGRLSWSADLQTVVESADGWSRDSRDSAAAVPKCVVIDPNFDWGDDRPPARPWEDTVIYECHVKGLTKLHPGVASDLRGTYAAVAAPPIVEHLVKLGVTAVELMPVHHFIDGRHVTEHGLSNYWGYNPICFSAPESRYASATRGQQVVEFKRMVQALHRAGIEVILDVVYNHTGEGDPRGATVCFRGIDNRAYYRLDPADPRRYWDSSGCGNTLNTTHPRTLQLIMDSLRYWVSDMHVDGFRFDLAPALAREHFNIDTFGRMWAMIRQDPVLAQVKLIAEPWDLGPEGYRSGSFPPGWSEWNDRYRDNLRRFWRGHPGELAEFACRITGSEDVFGLGGARQATASINFVTCHDGFTLQDLVSYEHKHNQANCEDNRDGTDRNLSRNHGHEGPTTEADILQLRERMKRNFMASLALSVGVPMISAGDENSRSQHGNNNAWCQDGDISWLDWDLDERQQAFQDFTREVLALRREHAAFRRGTFYEGRHVGPWDLKDVTWLGPDGREMTQLDWDDPARSTLGMLVAPQAAQRGQPPPATEPNNLLLLLFNGGAAPHRFTLPASLIPAAGQWIRRVDTGPSAAGVVATRSVQLVPHSLQLLEFIQA